MKLGHFRMILNYEKIKFKKSYKQQATKDLTGPELWDIMGSCLHDLNLLNSSGPSRVRRNSMSTYRATVYQRSEGFFGLVLLSAAITP